MTWVSMPRRGEAMTYELKFALNMLVRVVFVDGNVRAFNPLESLDPWVQAMFDDEDHYRAFVSDLRDFAREQRLERAHDPAPVRS